MRESANIIARSHGVHHTPYEYRGAQAWGCGRQYQRVPLDVVERNIIKSYGHIPCDPSREWTFDFTTFAFANIDKQYFYSTAMAILERGVEQVEKELEPLSWWAGAAPARRGVIVDIVFKNGMNAMADKALSTLCDASKLAQIGAVIIHDASCAREHQLPCSLNQYGSRSHYLSQMAITGEWPEWSK